MLILKMENGYETEIKSFGKCFGTEDFKEEQPLLEKEKPFYWKIIIRK
jgi:enoyl-CoA hydratase